MNDVIQVSRPHSFVGRQGVKGQQGVILLESLIAILIFSMGLIALMGLQAAMIGNTTDAKYRAEAAYIAQKRLGDMWANPTNLGSFVEANTDISAQLPNGRRTVTLPTANQVQVAVTWQVPGKPDVHNVTLNARIAGG
jgi:type IV pilus assembly protein PilV